MTHDPNGGSALTSLTWIFCPQVPSHLIGGHKGHFSLSAQHIIWGELLLSNSRKFYSSCGLKGPRPEFICAPDRDQSKQRVREGPSFELMHTTQGRGSCSWGCQGPYSRSVGRAFLCYKRMRATDEEKQKQIIRSKLWTATWKASLQSGGPASVSSVTSPGSAA